MPRNVYLTAAEHKPENAMQDPEAIARFYERCTDLMRALLDELAASPDAPRTFPDVEDALAWPRRRIASVLGGVWHGGGCALRVLDEHLC